MKLPTHECPYGLKAKELLEQAGYEIDEHLLTSREDTDAYQQKEGVSTTPQVFIDGRRIGGSSDLERYLEAESADGS
ncbi:MAG: glutaredoxin [Sphingomicrobium sp.]